MVAQMKHKKAGGTKGKKAKSPTATASSYSNLAGSPMDAADHPVNSLPTPMGGLHMGTDMGLNAATSEGY